MFLIGTQRFNFVPLLGKCFHMAFKRPHLSYRQAEPPSVKSLYRASFRMISRAIIV
jgi:hypothetical protein